MTPICNFAFDYHSRGCHWLPTQRVANYLRATNFTAVLIIWQSFVDETILGTSQVAKAAIHGLDGTRFAASTGFVVRCYFIVEKFFVDLTYEYFSTHRQIRKHTWTCILLKILRIPDSIDFSNRTRKIYFVVTTIPLL